MVIPQKGARGPRWWAVLHVAALVAGCLAYSQAPPALAQGKSQPTTPSVTGRRDPFAPLVARQPGRGQDTGPSCPGVGKETLVVGTLVLNGVVRSQNDMIAVVSSPDQRVYFLRKGEEVCNGRVSDISLEGVSFTERGRDAFGKTTDRVVMKRLYPSAGEQR